MNQRQQKALDSLARGGKLTAADVVAAARPARSPLHRFFTWDQAVAADKCRLDEARRLIRSYEYVVTTTPFVIRAPVYVRDPSVAGEQGYVSAARLRTDEELARDVVVAEFERVLGALRRAKAVAASINMLPEVERLHAEVEHVAGRVVSGEGSRA
jgi:hypothetical protein